MEPNDVATLTVTGTVDPAAQDQSQLTNTVTATPTETDPVPSDNTAQATVTVERLAGTEVTKLDNPDPAIAGQHVTYTLEVVNRGPSVADNTVLIDTLPAGLTFASGSDECTAEGQVVTCMLGTLAVGESESGIVEIVVTRRRPSLTAPP